MTVFFALKPSPELKSREAKLTDVCTVSSPDGDVSPLSAIIYPLKPKGATVIHAVTVATDIQRALPGASLVSLCENDSVVVTRKRYEPLWLTVGKVVLAFAVLFFAAGTSVINFYADVGMPDAFDKLLAIAGGEALGPIAVTALYCVGLILGMILFLGFPKKKDDPVPDTISVQNGQYDADVEDYIRSQNP